MKELFTEITQNFIISKSLPFKDNLMGQLFRNAIPLRIQELLNLDKTSYKVEGSIGQGNWAEIPWVSIFLKDITTSATNGYYIVYLFKSDMSGFYLSLNQGWTYFKNKYGTTEGRIKINDLSMIMRSKLSPVSNTFSYDSINLLASGPLGKGYELGHICGCYYDSSNIPSDEILTKDLKELIIEYKKLQSFIGDRTANDFNDFLLLNSDNMFLDTVDEDTKFITQAQEIISSSLPSQYELLPKEIIDEPVNVPNPVRKSGGKKTWPRNASIAANSIIHSNYKCTFNNNHISFTSKKTKKPYMEPHHLIPLSEQANFSVSLDVEANIVSLCSNCHNCVHYGIDEERLLILKQLYESRKDRLAKCGIYITLTELLSIYKVPEIIAI